MVAVGATSARHVRFWLRVTLAGRHDVELWSETGRQRAGVELSPAPGADGTTSFEYPTDVEGGELLEPATRYRYRITRAGQVIGEGGFETAPAGVGDAPRRFSFAFMSCHQPFADDGALDERSLRALAVLEPAFAEHDVKRVFLMGDQMYADFPKQRSLFDERYFARVAPPGRRSILDCTREEVRAIYQRRYRAFWSIRGFRELLAKVPCHATMDDHELKDNFGSAPEHASEQWAALRHGALDAFQDYQGQLVRARSEPRPDWFDFEVSYADAAVYCLDLRSQRRNDGQELRICSPEQFDALERFLEDNGDKRLVMIILSVPLMIFPTWIAALGLELAGEDSDAADRWSNPKASSSRDRLVRILFENQRRRPEQRAVLLGGDIHVGCVVQIVWRDTAVKPVYQLVSSAVSNRSDVVTRRLAALAPKIGTELRGEDDALWATVNLVEGRSGDRNPFEELNVGIIAVTRQANGALNVELKIISADDGEPPAPRVVFQMQLP